MLPVVVLAARRNGQPTSKLCCMEASLVIPEQLGLPFGYRIDRCVPFPTLPVQSERIEKEGSREGNEEENSTNYEQALAIFIKTMCIGLEFAKKLLAAKDTQAVTLCCSKPMPDLRLIASPIPGARRFDEGIEISQGELYRFNGKSKSIHQWIQQFVIKTKYHFLSLAGSQTMMDSDCLVKDSCIPVHRSLVSIDHCWKALQRLHGNKAKKLIPILTDSFLACACVPEYCLIVVMKDVSKHSIPEHPYFKKIEPRQLWVAFQSTVCDLLLPLAREDVVHVDIRFHPADWCLCNLTCRWESTQEWPTLTLIDFESLAIFSERKSRNRQKYAISVHHVGHMNSPFEFVFWQVLWAAYVWSTYPPDEVVTAQMFVETLFSDDNAELPVSRFRTILGDMEKPLKCLYSIRQADNDNDKVEYVEKAMEYLAAIFT